MKLIFTIPRSEDSETRKVKMKTGHILAGMLLALVLAWPQSVLAGNETDYRLDTVRVTAQKVGQDIQDVPDSVTAFSEVELEERDIEDFQEFTDFVPNMFLRKNSADNAIVIRGVSSFAGSLFSTAGFYVDGVNYPIHQMQDMDFFDIERVEVLKGPQGALYGRNSQAGVISIVTKQPGNEFGGKVFAEVGMWDAPENNPIFKEGMTLNLPVVQDVLAMRLTAQQENSKGWMYNEMLDSNALKTDHFNGRLTTRWTPTDRLEASLILEMRKRDDGLGVYRFTDGPYESGRSRLKWNGTSRDTVNADSEVLKVKYVADAVDIVSVTGRHNYNQDFANDMDMSPVDYGDSTAKYDVNILSEEFRVSSKEGEVRMIDWLVGVYGYLENVDTDYFGWGLHETRQDNWGAALFGQGTWNITRDWHLTAGGRVDHSALDGTKDITETGSDQHFEKNLEYTEFLPSLSLAYDITRDIMSYAKVSRGYLAGGFDYSTSMTEDQFTYDPEYSWNYELGVKSAFWDKRMTLNLTGFYIDIRDKQVAQLEPTASNPENRRIVNAAKARSYGAELELQVRPLEGLLLHSSVGYTNSELKDWQTTDDPFDYDGKKTPGSPDWTYNLGGTYRWNFGMFLSADMVGASSYYTDPKNLGKVDGRLLFNARIGYEGEDFDVVLWARNLFDEAYDENEWDWGGATLVQQGAPRSVGVRATYHF